MCGRPVAESSSIRSCRDLKGPGSRDGSSMHQNRIHRRRQAIPTDFSGVVVYRHSPVRDEGAPPPLGGKAKLRRRRRPDDANHQSLPCSLAVFGNADKGRLFAKLPSDSAVVSTLYGQWWRQKQGRENRAGDAAGRDPVAFEFYRRHDLRHAFAVASLVDDPDCIYRLSEHLGDTLVSTTEIYTGHLRRDGAMWRYTRDMRLFGSLATPAIPMHTEAA